MSVSFKLQHVGLLCRRAERRLPVDFDGAQPQAAAPPLGVCFMRCLLCGAEHPPQAHLGPESLAEDEVD